MGYEQQEQRPRDTQKREQEHKEVQTEEKQVQTEEQRHGQAHAQLQADQAHAHDQTEQHAAVRQRVEELEHFLMAANAEQQALVLATEANKALLIQRVVELEHRVVELQQQLSSTLAPGARGRADSEAHLNVPVPGEPQGRGEEEGALVLKQQLRATIDELVRCQHTAAQQRRTIQQLQRQLALQRESEVQGVSLRVHHPQSHLPACEGATCQHSCSPPAAISSAHGALPDQSGCTPLDVGGNGRHSPADKSGANSSLAGYSSLLNPSSLSISPNGVSTRSTLSTASWHSCRSLEIQSFASADTNHPPTFLPEPETEPEATASPAYPPVQSPTGTTPPRLSLPDSLSQHREQWSGGFLDRAAGFSDSETENSYSLTPTPHAPGTKLLNWI